MSISEIFSEFLNNLRIEPDFAQMISLRYGQITTCLNKTFREIDSETSNTLRVGSIGRATAIKGISDLDMLYIMPNGKWDDYKDGKQYQLLSDIANAIKERYPNTEIKIDRLVVQVLYTNFQIEVQPVFEQTDGTFKYPDTYNGGSWKITKPKDEILAMREFNNEKNNNLRRLCKMVRAWKNKLGIAMGGLLIDTLCYNFLKFTQDYDDKSYLYYDLMVRDFFEYLSKLPFQDHYQALGSNQDVKVKQNFQRSAKKAYELCLKAIDAGTNDNAYDKWKKVFGRSFPSKPLEAADKALVKSTYSWEDTEQFIEDTYPVDIRYKLKLDCDISQNGYREHSLSFFLKKKLRISPNKKLRFNIVDINVPDPYSIVWKVLNRGLEAQKRNCIRGQIIFDKGYKIRDETTTFNGDHIVECYAIKNGVVVARDRIKVPIQ